MLRSAFGGGRKLYQLFVAHAGGQDADHLEAALRYSAGLVEQDRIDPGSLLQYGAAPHQDASPHQPSDGGHHGGWRGQDQGAWARYQEHRDGSQPVPTEVERERGREQQHRQEITRESVRQTLDRRALFPGFLHQADHSRKRGLLARAGHRDVQQAVAVQRA